MSSAEITSKPSTKGERMGKAAPAPEEPLVNEFAEQHGQYEQLGKYHEARNAKVNRGGTAIERWLNEPNGPFGDNEKIAIRYCQMLWQRIDKKGPREDGIRVHGRYLWVGQTEHEALGELARLSKDFPTRAWSVFEDVCRFHSSAADAGTLMASNSRSASDAAKTCTLVVAGHVAIRIGL